MACYFFNIFQRNYKDIPEDLFIFNKALTLISIKNGTNSYRSTVCSGEVWLSGVVSVWATTSWRLTLNEWSACRMTRSWSCWHRRWARSVYKVHWERKTFQVLLHNKTISNQLSYFSDQHENYANINISAFDRCRGSQIHLTHVVVSIVSVFCHTKHNTIYIAGWQRWLNSTTHCYW